MISKSFAVPTRYSNKAIAFLKERLRKPCVILPFYGEYGFFVMSYIRLVHYLDCPYKIVCCKKGDECYFPSAAEFFYDWEDFIPDKLKCGFRERYKFGPVAELSQEELRLEAVLKIKYPSFRLIRFEYPIPFEAVKCFPLKLSPLVNYGLNPQVIICARRRKCIGDESDHGRRNFKRWPTIVRALKNAGYSVGAIGERETTYELTGIDVVSWRFPRRSDATLEMLNNCQLYIGTDTGPTHLAALLGTPMVLFRNKSDISYDLIVKSIKPIVRASKGYVNVIDEGWEHPEQVIRAALSFLSNRTSVKT
jgi:hypothetical protein